jgi:hypothetical protein
MTDEEYENRVLDLMEQLPSMTTLVSALPTSPTSHDPTILGK